MAGKSKTRIVMEEFKKGQLNIGKSPKKVTSRKQAIAIALSEQKRVNSKKNNILLYLNWLKNYADTVGYGCSNQPSSTKPFTFG